MTDPRKYDPESQDQESSGKGRKKSCIDRALPSPDFFYDVKADVQPIGSSPLMIRIFTIFLYLATIGAFAGTLAYYSMPSQLLTKESIVTSDWEVAGWNCRPLQKTSLHGLITTWTYSRCITEIQRPNVDNVIAVNKTNEPTTQYDFRFATDNDSTGTLSFYDEWYASSVLQADSWQLVGHDCQPEPPYSNTFNVAHNYSECLNAVQSPSNATVKVPSAGTDHQYFPFGFDKPCYAWTDAFTPLKATYPNQRLVDGTLFGYSSASDCLNVRDAADIDAAVTGWDGILATSGFGSEFICAYVKQNGNGFRCFKPDYPPTTQETAIQRYTARHTPMSICSPLKGNSPFECTREVETPLMTRMNLSLALAQAVFAVFGGVLVFLLRNVTRCRK